METLSTILMLSQFVLFVIVLANMARLLMDSLTSKIK